MKRRRFSALFVVVIALITSYVAYQRGYDRGYKEGLNNGSDIMIDTISDICHKPVPVFKGKNDERFVCLTEDEVNHIDDVLKQNGVGDDDNAGND
jgi:hypothetical protein